MSAESESAPRAAVHGIVPEGDAACWLGRLCPECGAVPEGAGAEDPTVPCWRCGAVRAESDQDASGGTASGG